MANGYFERGEVYWVKVGDSVGSEEAAGRPGVIVSSKKGNEVSPIVIIAYTTTQVKYGIINPTTYASGKKSWVLCNQLQTVDKSRLIRYLGKLTDQELRSVDDALEQTLDLGYIDDAALQEKDTEISDLKNEVSEAKTDLDKKNEEIAALKMEIEMWQKCYGRCMDMLVDTKVNADVQRRTMVEPKVGTAASLIPDLKPETPKEPEAPPVEPVNPTEQPEQPEGPVRTVNVNAASAQEINEATGIHIQTCFSIVGYRKKNGPYTKLEDLLSVHGIYPGTLKKCGDRIEFGEEKPVVMKRAGLVGGPDPGFEKVNVNTVKTASELTKLTGMCSRTTKGIIEYREEHGKFTCLEDLLKTPAFGAIAMKRYGHMLEV